jgi:hypothetical protein
MGIKSWQPYAFQDGEEEVALESCEFWSAFCEARIPSEVLEQFLPRLVPVLMKNMMYDEHADEVLEVEAADDSLIKVPPYLLKDLPLAPPPFCCVSTGFARQRRG